jgi:HAMP domain-containing protein
MNDHPTPDTTDRADPTDDRLRSQLRALPPASAAEVEALAASVMAQWSERHGRAAATAPQHLGGALAALSTIGSHRSRRRLWAGLTTGLVAGAVIAMVVWVQQPDPALDELMQADVLSQMAIGEM